MVEIDPSVNVLGDELRPCSMNPVTGFFRNGCCDTCDEDQGSHTVCAVMTAEFLSFSKSVGNDLSPPVPQYGFAGLKPGDQWCLCAGRFLQAYNDGKAPRVSIVSTHRRALDVEPIEDLREHALERS